jgi:hypothetical protein
VQFRDALDAPIQALPTAEAIEKMELKEPLILWSGIFGLFRAQKESIVKDIEYYINQFNPLQQRLQQLEKNKQTGRSTFMKHTFSPVFTDPSQQHLLHSLGRGENLVIQGPPGTGKSQTLTSIISNVLSNGGRCLVVCEKKTAMDVLYNNLKNLGLDELAVIVEDVYRDRSALVNSVRERTQLQYPKYQASPNFTRLMQSCAMQIQRLQKYHEKLLAPICGTETWSAVVASLAEADAKAPKEALDPYLKPRDFKFTADELEAMLRIIRDAEPLFRTLGTLQHPFNAFNERYFQIANTHQVFEDLKKSVEGLLYVVDSAQRDLLTYLYQYEKLLEEHYSDILAQKGRLIDDVVEMIEDGLKQSKYFFNKNKGAYRNLLSGISGKYKKLKDDKLTVLKNYTLLKNLHERYQYFKHEFLNLGNMDKMTFEDVKKDTEVYYDKLSNWFGSKEAAIRDYVNNLSEQYLHPHVDFRKQVKDITRNLDLFAQNFMKSQVFKVPFGFKNNVIRERLNNLEELDKNLKSLDEKFEEDFPKYHPLKYFWQSLDKAQQAAFTGLAQSGLSDWEGHFRSWYLQHLLNANADENIPQELHYKSIVKNLTKELGDLRQALQAHTLQYWRSKQSESVKRFNQEKSPVKVHSIYNLRGNTGGRRTPLRQIFETDPELFTSFFPVLMVNPVVCASMLPLAPGLFDVVIFDEASQLRLEDTFAALTRGTYKIISGDSQQMPPSDYFQATKTLLHDEELILDEDLDVDADNSSLRKEAVDYLSSSESLLEYCIAEGNFSEDFLQVHYRSRHPNLIDFSNAAFYGNRLTPMPAKENYQPIVFTALDGIYEEGVNEKEAKAIVERLLELLREKKAAGEPIPSIAVATFNIQQRNFILEWMQQRSLTEPEVGAAFEELFSAGLFVKNLENIQGDERDYLFISTTFGKRADASFVQNFGPINRQLGYRLLNVIITRAKHFVQVFTSIPSEYYGRYREHLTQAAGNSGKGVFYAYLAYCKAVSEGDEISRAAILKQVYENSSNKPLHQVYSAIDGQGAFAKIVADSLQADLPEGMQLATNANYLGFNIPILISNAEGKGVLALYFDLFDEGYSEEAYAWDMFREEHLQNMGLVVERVWSYNWWQNAVGEKERVLKSIEY